MININGRRIGPQEKPFVIAEISGNHGGSLENLLKTTQAFIILTKMNFQIKS